MNALTRLKNAGLSRAEIAAGVGVSAHMIGMYERFDRFPSRVRYLCIVELAESRGIKLLARDFCDPNEECEPLVNGVRGKAGTKKRKK